MRNMGNIIKINFKENKILVLSVIFSILLVFYIAIPTLSEYKNTNALYTVTAWDGTIASSYNGEGTIDDPYVITNGSELALLAVQLETTNFEGKYFVLGNDIVLNKGYFEYTKDDGIKYIEDGVPIVITPNSDNDAIKVFRHLNGFKGSFSGNGHAIYGLYIDESIDGQNALFTNLYGNISDLHVKKSLIYGGNVVAGIASKANNSILTNITYNGYVVTEDDNLDKMITIDVPDVQTYDFNTDNYININNLNYVPGMITKVTLRGKYNTNDLVSVLEIGGKEVTAGQFELDLGDKLITAIPMLYQSEDKSSFSLIDLEYEINYSYGNAAGIVSLAENTKIINVVNKASVYGNIYSSGIVNIVNGNTLINNVYNVGYIESDMLSSGLISDINLNNEDVTISNCYNDGVLAANNSALIGNVSNNLGKVNLINSFNTQDSFGINSIISSEVVVNDSYVINDKFTNEGEFVGEFVQTTLDNLNNMEFVKTNLNYNEYNSSGSNSDSVWVWQYDGNSLPILYIDDLNSSIANIHVKDYLWNSFNSSLGTYNFSTNFVFSIEKTNELSSIKEIYYYINNKKEPLNKMELDLITDWEKYDGIIGINEEGLYTIYAKIVDYNDNSIYINTDLLILDMSGSNVVISSSLSDDKWDTFRTSVLNYYIDKELSISIVADDLLSGIDKTYYYVSDGVLSLDEIEELDDWVLYTDSIFINSNRSIVYAKVIDNSGNSTYVNSDLIILNGYILNSLSAGMNGDIVDNLYINDKSSVSFNFAYKDIVEYSSGSKHQIISNVLLPKNTKITIIDKIKSKVYSYITDESDYGYSICDNDKCEAKYNFELFKEIGSKNKFQESNYTGMINEDFVIFIDFINTDIKENIEDISISMKLDNNNPNEVRNTLSNSIKKFSIISENSYAYFTLDSEFNDTINYNSDNIYTIPFNAKINYKLLNGNKIFDTTFEGKKMGLSLKMVNANGNIIDRYYLKNMLFKIGDKKYSPSSDGIIRIDFEDGINDISNNLVVQTYFDNSKLEMGNYKFIIELYTSYDGIYSNESLANVEIPVYVGENIYNTEDAFNVIMSDEDRIISSKVNEFNFGILLGDEYNISDVKVSLYKKDSLSPYDQKYSIIDLGEYVIDNNLELYNEKIYCVLNGIDDSGVLNIKLDTSKLEKKGYMFVFELYENGRIVNKIGKKFITK